MATYAAHATLSIVHWSPLSCSLSDCTADNENDYEEEKEEEENCDDGSAAANQTQICV